MFSLQKFTCFLFKKILLKKKRKGNNKKFILETSNVRTKYTCILNQTKKGTYSGIFRV